MGAAALMGFFNAFHVRASGALSATERSTLAAKKDAKCFNTSLEEAGSASSVSAVAKDSSERAVAKNV